MGLPACTLFLVGWGLVLAAGHGGNSAGGSEAVWTIGGAMVYASLPLFAVAAVLELRTRRAGGRPR